MRKIAILSFISIIAGCAGGCIRLPVRHPIRPILHQPTEISAKLEYPKGESFSLREYDLVTNKVCVRKKVDLVVHTAHWQTNKTVTLECYVPPSTSPLPVIMLLPITAGEKYELERFLAAYLARNGFAAVIVHREVRPKCPSAEEMNTFMHQSILDNRQVIDWIESRNEFDAARIGVLGTSMGAIKGAMLAGADSRVRANVLALVGSDVGYILAHSKDGGVRRYRREYMAEHHVTRQEMYEQLEKHLEWDPKFLAPYAAPERTLLILGLCDRVVPFKKGIELRKQMGSPETEIVPSGHYTALLYIFHIRHCALTFFREKFRSPTKTD